MTSDHIPAPGTHAAIDAGCTCRIRYSDDSGLTWDADGRIVTNWVETDPNCPLTLPLAPQTGDATDPPDWDIQP